MMFIEGGNELEKGALPVLPSSNDVIQISIIKGRFEATFVERFSLPLAHIQISVRWSLSVFHRRALSLQVMFSFRISEAVLDLSG